MNLFKSIRRDLHVAQSDFWPSNAHTPSKTIKTIEGGSNFLK